MALKASNSRVSAVRPTPPTAPTLSELREYRDEVLDLAARHHAHNVRVVGSVARGEAEAASDIDVLVDFDSNVDGFDQIDLMQALSDLLGRDVQVASSSGLRPRVRENLLRDAVDL